MSEICAVARPGRWRRAGRRSAAGITAAAAVTAMVALAPAAAAAPAAGPPSVLHVVKVASQDVAPQPGSEPDTTVEPDVAVSPLNRSIAVAAAHDGRYPDGGAVGITYSWTHDGGASWHHQPLPGLTTSTGGPQPWARASDPIVAFGPDGDVYISTLLIALTCPSAVAVSRSTDGGVTFAPPVLAHYSASCAVSDDKDTMIVDTSPSSPHEGRLYVFWTPFLTDIFGNPDGSPQAMVYSDDHGATWSAPVAVSAPHANTQNSTPMLQPDGTIVDGYIDYGNQAQHNEETGFRHHESVIQPAAAPAAAAPPPPLIRTAISTNGGKSFHPGGVVTSDLGPGPPGIRCCLDSATSDPRTGRLYTAWNSTDLSEVKLSTSTDGAHWSPATLVNRNPSPTQDGVNVDVAAYAGTVSVSYGLTNADTSHGRYAQQYIATARPDSPFIAIAVGPRSNYAYAAQSEGIFPGDYIGTAMTSGRLYAVWCVSSKPPTAGAKYHQVVYGATLGL